MPPKKDVPKKDAPKDDKDRPKQEPPKQEPPEQEPPKKYVPGAVYTSNDKKDKGAKESRRRKKSGSKDEPAEAGPSSSVASPPPALPGYGAGSSSTKPPTSTGIVQSPASAGARQPPQIHSQATSATTSSTRPAQPSAQTGTHQASNQPGQASMSNKLVNRPAAAGGPPPGRNLPAPSSSNEGVSAGKVSSSANLPKDNSSRFGDGNIGVLELKGQPPRPSSNLENRIHFKTNHFELTHDPIVLWHYGIIVRPEVKGPKLTQVIKIALGSDQYQILKSTIVTDFSAILLSVKKVPRECQQIKIRYKSELENQASDNAKEYEISLDPIGIVDLSKAELYLQHMERSSSGLPIEQALDIILGHHRKMSNDIAVINKRKAFTINSTAAGYDSYELATAHLIALRGFFSSVRMSQQNFLVNINVSHGAFYRDPTSLARLIQWLWNLPNVDNSKVSGLLRGLRVNSLHIQRVWSIWGFPRNGDGHGYMLHPPKFDYPNALTHTPEQIRIFYDEKSKGSSTDEARTLSEKDKEMAKIGRLKPHGEGCACQGKWRTVAQYFAQARMQPISPQNKLLPLVNVGSNRRPTYLPSHLCNVWPGQVSKLKLDQTQTKAMIKFAVRTPDANANSISSGGFTTLGLNTSNRELESFGVHVNANMVRLMGRTLPQPSLVYGNEKLAKMVGSKWNLVNLEFHTPKTLDFWACTRIIRGEEDGPVQEEPCKGRLAGFQRHLKQKGITAEVSDEFHGDLDLRGNDYERRLEDWFKESRDYQVKFMLVVLPGRPTSELYNSIKRCGDIKYGIHTVCVKLDKFGGDLYDHNVALKINLKRGGINHVLKENDYGPVFRRKTMVVGIDVVHPSPGEDSAPSVAAVVASRDQELSQWPADLRINTSRQEMVVMLREMLTTRLEHYQEINNLLPENILIYRDGVGEGQYKIVLEEELPRLRDACRSLYGKDYVEGTNPRISLIVVGKRHHTRFYRTNAQGVILSKSSSNPPYGTVVDNTITQDCNWDFFLQSHTAITGTARPAHYFVLLDEIFRATTTTKAVRELELLTYNMCYLYGKATTSVSIPPPVYYADKACDRGRRYLSRVFDQGQRRGTAAQDADVQIHTDLKNSMFYI